MSTLTKSEAYVRESCYLQNQGENDRTFRLSIKEWTRVHIKLNGQYETMFNDPSQRLIVNIFEEGRHTNLYNKELYGRDSVIRTYSAEGKLMDLDIQVKLQSCHGASKYSAANVEIIAYYVRDAQENEENEDGL